LVGEVDAVVRAPRLASFSRALECRSSGEQRALEVEGVREVVIAGDVGSHLDVMRSCGDLL
jgi:hypothetical protein